MLYCKPSLVRVGSYIYIPLNNFIGSTLSMASFGFAGTSTLSLPVLHSLPKRAVQDTPNNVAFKRTVSLLDTARVQRTVSNFGSDVLQVI